MEAVLPRYVELETSRRCNRTCAWCPNGEHERRDQHLMEWPLFEKILAELAELDYRGWLANHNYNEPLASPRVLQELAHVREVLPRARPAIYTNGDYLKAALFRQLLDVGVQYVRVTRYPHRAETQPTFEGLRKWARQAGLDGLPWEQRPVRQGIALACQVGTVKVEVIGPDITGTYNSRGGSVSLPLLASTRTDPCLMTATSASIDYLGRMKMCCCVYPDIPSHQGYVVGSLAERSFADLWGGDQMTAYRAAHAVADWSLSPACRTCRQPLPETRREDSDA